MTIATAYAEQDRGLELDSIEDLARFRADVDRTLIPEQPLIVTFERRGCAIYLGLHEELGFVHVTPVPDGPPYLITVGDAGRGGTVEFFLHRTHHTEIPSRHLIPVEQAWRAVAHYLLSGELLNVIDWEEV